MELKVDVKDEEGEYNQNIINYIIKELIKNILKAHELERWLKG